MKRTHIFTLLAVLVLVAGISAAVLHNGVNAQQRLREEARSVELMGYFEALDACSLDLPDWAYDNDVVTTSEVTNHIPGLLQVTYNVTPGSAHQFKDDHAELNMTVTKQVISEKGFLWYYENVTSIQTTCDSYSVTTSIGE